MSEMIHFPSPDKERYSKLSNQFPEPLLKLKHPLEGACGPIKPYELSTPVEELAPLYAKHIRTPVK